MKHFSKMALASSARALNLLDRNPASPSFGCFDRYYWHFKTKDFPSASYQMGCEFLARLWALKDKDNPFFQNPQLLSWIKASMAYNLRIQHKDGSFDEWYPNERGWAGPTAYVIHALVKAFEITSHQLPEAFKNTMQKAFAKAGNFLLKQKEGADLANHYALFLLTLYEISQQVPYFNKGLNFENLLKGFKSLVSLEEGWSQEYDGADFAYNLATLSFLARLDKIHPHPYLKEYAEKSFAFLSHFVYPNGDFGGLGSRETIHLYPFALKYWGQTFEIARSMDAHLQKCGSYEKLKPSDQDDHYLFYRLSEYMEAEEHGSIAVAQQAEEHGSIAVAQQVEEYGSIAVTQQAEEYGSIAVTQQAEEYDSIAMARQKEDSKLSIKNPRQQKTKPPLAELKRTLPCQTKIDFEKYFQKAGLFVCKTQHLYFAVNLKRGGALRLYNSQTGDCALKDTGWILRQKNQSLLTNALHSESQHITINKGEITVEGHIMPLNTKYFHPLSFSAFRLLSLLCRHYKLAFLLKKAIRKSLILRPKNSKYKFKRIITWKKDLFCIKDIIKHPQVEKIFYSRIGGLRYVPQSRYFEMPDLHSPHSVFTPGEYKKGLIVKQSFRLQAKGDDGFRISCDPLV